MAHFSQRLLARRNRLGITQQDLARISGISPTAISAWERGLNVPTGRLLEKLASALNVSAGWLMGGPHSEESTQAVELNDRARNPYSSNSDLRMRDLTARLASLPPEARTIAFKRIDEVLSEVFDLFSPPEFSGDAEALKRDLEHVERLEKAASQRLGEASPGQNAERASTGSRKGIG